MKEYFSAENKNINHLESKIWYRSLKVFYIVFFILSLVGYNMFIWNNAEKKQTIPIKMTREEYMAKYGETVEQAQERAEKGQGLTYQQLLDMGAKPVVQSSHKTIEYLIVGNLLILLFFEAFRRAFYYIFLGKIRP